MRMRHLFILFTNIQKKQTFSFIFNTPKAINENMIKFRPIRDSDN